METLHPPLPITSPNIGPGTLSAPAPIEIVYQIAGTQETSPLAHEGSAAALGHAATFEWFRSPTSEMPKVTFHVPHMDLVHFGNQPAGTLTIQTPEVPSLADLAADASAGVMQALDIKPVTLKQHIQNDATGPFRRHRYTGVHSEKAMARSENENEALSPIRRRIIKGLATLALIGTLAGGANLKPDAGLSAHPGVSQEVSPQAADRTMQPQAETVTVLRGGQNIMGVSPRQQKIIRTLPGLSADQRKTLTDYTDAIHKIEGQLGGVNADVMLAQGIWEGGWGKSALAKKGHNLFGMKAGKSWKGDKDWYNTWEEVNGRRVPQPALFREYPNDAASFADHAKQMTTLPWFKDALGKSASKYLDGILNGNMKYATDSTYKAKIMNVINTYELPELTKIDTEPPHLVQATNATMLERIKTKIAQYALPNYRPIGSKRATEMRPAYINALKHARDTDTDAYISDSGGLDCGDLVVRVMRDSGADPNYNSSEGNTKWQLDYLKRNSDDQSKNPALYHHLKSNEKLQPGDIAIQNNNQVHHTFFYVGRGMTGLDDKGRPVPFNGVLASASQGNRAPMASNDYNRAAFEWYRLVGINKPVEAASGVQAKPGS